MWHDEPNKRSITYTADKDIPADATIELEIWPGEKVITVPFAFTDLKLP
jgi:hypothetical protein